MIDAAGRRPINLGGEAFIIPIIMLIPPFFCIFNPGVMFFLALTGLAIMSLDAMPILFPELWPSSNAAAHISQNFSFVQSQFQPFWEG